MMAAQQWHNDGDGGSGSGRHKGSISNMMYPNVSCIVIRCQLSKIYAHIKQLMCVSVSMCQHLDDY